jgi:hypothetical protein
VTAVGAGIGGFLFCDGIAGLSASRQWSMQSANIMSSSSSSGHSRLGQGLHQTWRTRKFYWFSSFLHWGDNCKSHSNWKMF